MTREIKKLKEKIKEQEYYEERSIDELDRIRHNLTILRNKLTKEYSKLNVGDKIMD